MAAIEAVGVKEKSHDDTEVAGEILEFRGHGVSNKLCGRSQQTGLHTGTTSPALAYSEVSVVCLEPLE